MATKQDDVATVKIVIWDVWIRLFHWALVVAVCFQLFSGKTAILFYEYHQQTGEIVLGLILFRILWGLVGSSNVRFVNFISSPIEALRHIGQLLSGRLHPERGHNAAGAWAVVILLLLIATLACTGLFITDQEELMEGALYGTFSSSTSDWLYSVHHLAAEMLMIMVVLHLVALLTYLFRAGQNLIVPMFTGKMQWPSNVAEDKLKIQRSWMAILCIVIAAAVVISIVR